MKERKGLFLGIFSAVGMLMLILDSKVALDGAHQGILLCLRSVLPSLLPFVFLSILLTGTLVGKKIPFLRPIGHLCGIPEGSESLLAIGLIGGYPVGAQSICRAYQSKQLTKQEANRLLSFCNNAGPAFIFGFTGMLFTTSQRVWFLWGIHILSALLVGMLMPGKSRHSHTASAANPIRPTDALRTTLRVMAEICGWVILFRIMISFCNRWFLWLLPKTLQVIFVGLLELTNGCHEIASLQNEQLRFILCSFFLSFGGFSIAMQTISVTEGLHIRFYFYGKLLQSILSVCISFVVTPFLFPSNAGFTSFLPVFLIIPILFVIFFTILKKTVAKPQVLVYNEPINR